MLYVALLVDGFSLREHTSVSVKDSSHFSELFTSDRDRAASRQPEL